MHRKKVDKNQTEIVEALRRHGAKVFVSSFVGHGFPDVIAMINGEFWLIEIKSSRKSSLTRAQQNVHSLFRGGKIIVGYDKDDVLSKTGLVPLITDELLEKAYTD